MASMTIARERVVSAVMSSRRQTSAVFDLLSPWQLPQAMASLVAYGAAIEDFNCWCHFAGIGPLQFHWKKETIKMTDDKKTSIADRLGAIEGDGMVIIATDHDAEHPLYGNVAQMRID